jgi:ABC-type multidrug transport system permease subunit
MQKAAEIFPLTQMLEGARSVMLDGAGILAIWPQLLSLAAMTFLFLALGAAGFKLTAG